MTPRPTTNASPITQPCALCESPAGRRCVGLDGQPVPFHHARVAALRAAGKGAAK